MNYDLRALQDLRQEFLGLLSDMEAEIELRLKPIVSEDENEHSPEEDELYEDDEALSSVLTEEDYARYQRHVVELLFSGTLSAPTADSS